MDGAPKSSGRHGGRKAHKKKDWDSCSPAADDFAFMFARSKNQIIWGGNYFTKHLPPSMGWIYWDKGQAGQLGSSDGELAFTSYQRALRSFRLNRVALLKDKTVHPTQKPMALMRFCLSYAFACGEVKTVLDPYGGSGTVARVCKDNGLSCVMIEADEEFCEGAARRMGQTAFSFDEDSEAA